MRPTGTPPVVLVVEDEWLARAAIAQALRGAGWEVLATRTAEAAIACLQAGHRIDVVFTDILLGGRLNGWDLADAFRKARPDMPVIYTSGNVVDASRAVGTSCFFNKPYVPAAVIEACWRLALSTPPRA